MNGFPINVHINTYSDVESQCCFGPNLINAFPARSKFELLRRQRAGREGVELERDRWETLHETDKHEWHLIVGILTAIISLEQIGNNEKWTNLLAKTNTRACIERQEDERVLDQIFLDTLIEETVRIKLFGCILCVWPMMAGRQRDQSHLPSGPQRSLRRCITKTEYTILIRRVSRLSQVEQEVHTWYRQEHRKACHWDQGWVTWWDECFLWKCMSPGKPLCDSDMLYRTLKGTMGNRRRVSGW